MTNIKEANLSGQWKTDKGIKITITEKVEIPAQSVWVGKSEDGRQVFFTDEAKSLFHDLGELIERRRGAEDVW